MVSKKEKENIFKKKGEYLSKNPILPLNKCYIPLCLLNNG